MEYGAGVYMALYSGSPVLAFVLTEVKLIVGAAQTPASPTIRNGWTVSEES